MKMPVRGCDHLGVLSGNASRLIKFYTGPLGFHQDKEEVIPRSVIEPIFGLASDCRLVKLSAQVPSGKQRSAVPSRGFVIEIFEPLSTRAVRRLNRRVGINHVGLVVDNREEFCRLLADRGVKVIVVRRNSHQVFFIRDPDGNRIEIRDPM